MAGACFVGVMSGTSLDGIDAVAAHFEGEHCTVVGSARVEFSAALRRELLDLQASGADELARAARAANELADRYAEAIVVACDNARVLPADVAAAGVHGQTVRHRPDDGYTIQLNNPARVAERCGVTIVADFRSRDIAAGGQGAPLVPAFHRALFGRADRHRLVLNLGGIANLTDLPAGGGMTGFDTGPGNVLLDLWHERHRGGPYDDAGAWAAGGRVDEALLAILLSDRYFAEPPPKSTGRDRFNAAWVDAALMRRGELLAPGDVQATFVALTARSVGDAVARHAAGSREVLVCGGGAHNESLMRALTAALAPRAVTTTAEVGVPVGQVEALAFAWLAREMVAGRAVDLAAVTGARGPRVLGAIYPR